MLLILFRHTNEGCACLRSFYVMDHNGCGGDSGLLSVIDNADRSPVGECPWELTGPFPKILYANTNSVVAGTVIELFLLLQT